MFTLYSQPLLDVISDHDCDYHKHADDTELSKDASPDQFDSVQSCIQTCIGDVLIWMNSNKLKLNTDKTVGSASRLALVESESENIGGNSVPFKTSVKYLGVHLDRTLSMRQHIDRLSRIPPGASTSRINQTVSFPKCHCKICRGNGQFSS